jgi:hypothetical protein
MFNLTADDVGGVIFRGRIETRRRAGKKYQTTDKGWNAAEFRINESVSAQS